jgi:hypothetical protein
VLRTTRAGILEPDLVPPSALRPVGFVVDFRRGQREITLT